VLLAVACGHALLRPGAHSVYPVYADAGRRWLAGADLYCDLTEAYRYSPLATAQLVPFAALPDRLGAAGWRLMNTAVYLTGLALWMKNVLPAGLSGRRRALLFLLVLPLSVGSVYNGQCNPAITGLLLAGLAAAAASRWGLAALCLAVACAFKPFVLATGLLLVVTAPGPFAWRLAGMLAAVALVPFALQAPGYVARQYADWLAALWGEDRGGWPLKDSYRDLWLLCRAWHLPVSRAAYQVVQVASGAGAAAVCVLGRRAGWPPRRLLTALLSMGSGWMVLCGPATESATYLVLAPALAWAVLEAAGRPGVLRAGALAAYGLLAVAAVAAWFPGAARFHALALQPLAALVFLAAVVADLCRELVGRPSFGPRTGDPALSPS
jgi:hypothetical protein